MKTVKRMAMVLLVLTLLLCVATAVSYAAESSEVPEGLEYSSSDGKVTITGYTGSAVELIIPATIEGFSVTGVGDLAFALCDHLTSITIPSSVTSIGEAAFYGCANLTEVVIPDSVTSIGDSAFDYCSSLTEIAIPGSVTSIGNYAFHWCLALTSVEISNGVTSIGEAAFLGCSSLTEIAIPDSVTSIGNSAFVGCSSLTEIVIPGSVTNIGDYAFAECRSLTEIVIPDSVISVGAGLLSACISLTSVELPDDMVRFGDYMFAWCESLTSIEIPDTLTSIGSYAFYCCSSLTEIVIPDGVTSIGDYAFASCSGLTSIVIPDNVNSIDDYVFNWCIGLTSIVIPDGVTSIGDYAFASCCWLTSIVIPDGVTELSENAFGGCTELAKLSFLGSAPDCNYQELFTQTERTEVTVCYPAGDSSWDDIVTGEYSGVTVTWNPVTCWGLLGFQKVNAYTDGMFTDVVPNSWYEANLERAYELGLMKGTGDSAFSPTKNITIAEVITIAARIHSIYHTGNADFVQGSPWYQVYVDYAIENGIIGANSYSNYNAPATRAMCAAILGAAVPESELQAINNITVIPDVAQDSSWGKAVYRLYNAGVLTGTDEYGTFAPANRITRAEVAAIATRIVDASLRKTYAPKIAVAE